MASSSAGSPLPPSPVGSPPSSSPLPPEQTPLSSTPLLPTAFNSEIDNSYLQPVYCGANVTVFGAYCSIMQFATANKLTYSAIEELLKLLQILCPSPNQLPTTLYRFKSFFRQYGSGFEQQRVCCKCFAYLDEGEVCLPVLTKITLYVTLKVLVYSSVLLFKNRYRLSYPVSTVYLLCCSAT